MKVGVIIPDRGDRPEFLENCKRLIANQKNCQYQPFRVEIVGYPPRDEQIDITKRYRFGYDSFRNLDYDVLALMENDDWYAPDYLEYMVGEWIKAGKPDLFGTNYTIYYHLKLRAYFTMRHEQRSSAMSTLIRPGLKVPWPLDHDPYTDQWLWTHMQNKKVFEPKKIICVGMKHGVGKTGGRSHIDQLHRFINKDEDMYWLRHTVDQESFDFYNQYSDKLRAI